MKSSPRIIQEIKDDSESVASRLWSKVDKTDTCWNWVGAIGENGYGHFWLNGRYVSPHRVSYVLTHGSIPDSLTVDHLCRNRRCVNPDHLEAVTIGVNVRRSPLAPPATNSRKTHCPKGHPLVAGNLMVYALEKQGRRSCLTCARIRYKKYDSERRKK